MKLPLKAIRCEPVCKTVGDPRSKPYHTELRKILATRFIKKQFPISVEQCGNIYNVIVGMARFHALKDSGVVSFEADVIAPPLTEHPTVEVYYVPKYRVLTGRHHVMAVKNACLQPNILARIYDKDGKFVDQTSISLGDVDV